MQTKDIADRISDLLSRLVPCAASIQEGDDGVPVLYLSFMVASELDGMRWRRMQRQCPLWRERVGAVGAMFLDAAAHPTRKWRVRHVLMDDDGFEVVVGGRYKSSATGSVRRVSLAFALADDGVMAENLPLVSAITFGLINANGVVVCDATTCRVRVANVPSAEREGC